MARRASLRQRLAPLRTPFAGGGSVHIQVKRDNFLATALDKLPRDPRDWRKNWKFKFEGEPAIDAGGVSREFWTLLSASLFHPTAGLFMYSATDNLSYQVRAWRGTRKLACSLYPPAESLVLPSNRRARSIPLPLGCTPRKWRSGYSVSRGGSWQRRFSTIISWPSA